MSQEDLKREITSLLERADHKGLAQLARKRPPTVRLLISMTYDKAGLLSWRAMEAIGRITAGLPAEKGRNTIQRLLWMMREESGSNAWSAGEIIAEIVRANPGPFEDIVPIVISFHDEKILRTGSLWCMARVGEVRADLVEPFADVALGYLESQDPSDRGHALLALKALGNDRYCHAVKRLTGDGAVFRYYDGASMREVSIGELAEEAAQFCGSP